MTVYEAARANMIEGQIRPNKVTDEAVLGAFARIRRELFVPQPLWGVAYVDKDLPLGRGRYLMQPMVAARLIQAAEIGRTDTALIVGAGVCYEAAVISLLARSVVAVEPDAELARTGRAALVEHRIAAVTVVEEPIREGHRARAPYEVILFGGAVAEIPGEISSQLAEGGRMLALLRSGDTLGRAVITVRTGKLLAQRGIFEAATPLLPGFAPKPAFVF